MIVTRTFTGAPLRKLGLKIHRFAVAIALCSRPKLGFGARTLWFAAAWLVATAEQGVSARQLARELDLGSYETAWTMLHRFRRAMVRSGRPRL